MISEKDARELLRDRKIERDLSEARSCSEIAIALGLVTMGSEVNVELPEQAQQAIGYNQGNE